jgi:hypothetical protein
MLRMLANTSVNRTACKLGLQAPSALRAPAIGYLKRSPDRRRSGERGSRLRTAGAPACGGRTRGWNRRAFGPQLSCGPRWADRRDSRARTDSCVVSGGAVNLRQRSL